MKLLRPWAVAVAAAACFACSAAAADPLKIGLQFTRWAGRWYRPFTIALHHRNHAVEQIAQIIAQFVVICPNQACTRKISI